MRDFIHVNLFEVRAIAQNPRREERERERQTDIYQIGKMDSNLKIRNVPKSSIF